MNFEELKNYLKYRMGNDDTITSWLGIWVNLAYKDLTSRNKLVFGNATLYLNNYQFPLLDVVEDKPLLANSDSLNLNAFIYNPAVIYDVKDKTNNINLLRKSYRYFTNLPPLKAKYPTMYTHYGNKLYFYPVPNENITLQISYRKRINALSNDSDVPEIPEEWHEAILLLATMKGFYWKMEYEKAREVQGELVAFLQDRIGLQIQEELDEDDTPSVIIHPQYRG